MAVAPLLRAYDATGAAWERGPARIYDRLAEVVLGMARVPVRGRTVLDIGAGTGAASRAVAAAGGSPFALDGAWGMLSSAARGPVPGTQADVLDLPFRDGAFGGAVAAFSINHVDDPVRGLREMARVVAPGGPLLASSYAEDDTHPVKGAVEAALAEAGWTPEPWYLALRRDVVPRLAAPDRCAAVAAEAGLDAAVHPVRVPFPGLEPEMLVDWRLGMVQHAPFVSRLTPAGAAAVRQRALALLGSSPPPLVRSIIVISAAA